MTKLIIISLGTRTGAHLLERILQKQEDTPIFTQHILNKTVEYDVSLDSAADGSKIALIMDLFIDDVHSSDKMEFPIHINTSSDIPQSFYFNLKSKDGMEYRFYKVNFVGENFARAVDMRLREKSQSEEEAD